MTETYIEKRKRGFFGWVFLLVFLGWNVLMVMWLFVVGDHSSNVINTSQSEAERAGAAIGTGIGVIMILFVWCIGAVITGLLALVTRGGKSVTVRRA
jgi:hypothetical protein